MKTLRLLRSTLSLSLLAPLTIFAACAGEPEGSPYDGDFPVSGPEITEGAPDNDSLPDDNKADAVYPARFTDLVAQQSRVKSQGSRGVCSIFAATALVENLYIKAGMTEADFSEQYMQWSVKVQLGEFPRTDGSNGSSNIKSVVDYGVVEESAWPYQTQPWGTSNDAACTGENRPTRCYTNGEPPESATAATKFRLPTSRYVNTNSIKAQLSGKGSGVVVGMTFFYQAWNHRASTLPVSSEMWREGFVTYPNPADKAASLVKRAGHAILIVGWDDNLEAPMRDETGAEIKNADGTTKMEKGFWLFKNSWGTGSFGIANPEGDGYGWLSMKYVKEYGSAVASDVPTLETPDEVCDDAGSLDEDGDGNANCDDSDCAAHPECNSTPTSFTYDQDVDQAIPDNSTTGVSSTITSTDGGTVGLVEIDTYISHTWRGDLTVTLTHDGTTKTIFDRTGGSADDLVDTFSVDGFAGSSVGGNWTLKVTDGSGQDTGTFEAWTLRIAGS